MSKLSKQKARARKGRFQKPSLTRVIGANDNQPQAVNDNEVQPFDMSREPGVKETPNQRIFRQMMRRALDDRPAPAVAYDPSRLTDTQVKELRRAEEKLNSGDPRRIEAGRKAVEEIAKAIRLRVEDHEREQAKQQIRSLEELRGAVIVEAGKNEPPGRLRIITRDGLETLLTAKSINRTQHAAGLRYRADYELLDPERSLTPPSIDQTRKIVRGGDGFAQKRREREEFVRDIEAMIQEEDPTFRGALGRSDVERLGRAVWALREVAGKGSNLLSLTSSGSVRRATSTALFTALNCAAIAYGLE